MPQQTTFLRVKQEEEEPQLRALSPGNKIRDGGEGKGEWRVAVMV